MSHLANGKGGLRCSQKSERQSNLYIFPDTSVAPLALFYLTVFCFSLKNRNKSLVSIGLRVVAFKSKCSEVVLLPCVKV